MTRRTSAIRNQSTKVRFRSIANAKRAMKMVTDQRIVAVAEVAEPEVVVATAEAAAEKVLRRTTSKLPMAATVMARENEEEADVVVLVVLVVVVLAATEPQLKVLLVARKPDTVVNASIRVTTIHEEHPAKTDLLATTIISRQLREVMPLVEVEVAHVRAAEASEETEETVSVVEAIMEVKTAKTSVEIAADNLVAVPVKAAWAETAATEEVLAEVVQEAVHAEAVLQAKKLPTRTEQSAI